MSTNFGRATIAALFALLFTHCVFAGTLTVNNVEELYSAVNDPLNEGSVIQLEPGIYALSVNDPNGVPRPNRGRLELQTNMSLIGVVDDRSAVVIDAFNLPATSFTPQPSAVIRMGKGQNSIEWLTVRDGRFAQANIDTGLQIPGTAFVRLAHISSSGSIRGFNGLNFGPAASGEILELDIEDSDFFNNTFNLSEGIRIGNFQGAVGGIVNARMVGNRAWGQKQGRLIVNNRALNSVVNVFSAGNRFFGNGAGTIVIGGLSSNSTPANGNTINFEAHGDHFTDNTFFTEFDEGGLVVLGTENISIPNGTNNNTVNVALWGCRMADNNSWDLSGWAARSLPESIGVPGTNNHVTITIHGEGKGNGKWQPTEFFSDGSPYDPSNSITVIR